jgi:hypothetical protein
MKYKTSELTGALLDAAVAKAEGLLFSHIEDGKPWLFLTELRTASVKECPRFSVSGDAAVPIIERERIDLSHAWPGSHFAAIGRNVTAEINSGGPSYGETVLIAAMRAYVASKLGDEVEI